MDVFLYILNSDSYIEELKEQKKYKFIPKFFLKKIDVFSREKIIEKFKFNNNIVGYNIGLTALENISEEKIIQKIENLIKRNLIEDTISTIIFENGSNYSLEDKLIKKNILKSNNGSKNAKLQIIPHIIKNMANKFYQLEKDLELLIIYKDEGDLKQLIKKTPFSIKNIYIYSQNEISSIKIAEDVLKNTGLSLGIIKDIKKVERFDIIINFKDDTDFINWVKEKSVIFNIYNNICYNESKSIIVEDFIFNSSNNFNFKSNIPSSIYKYNHGFRMKDFVKVKVNNDIVNKEEFYKLVNCS
ncbi:hypothetical protein [Senegalia massiliensis]|uniref:Uncharacterized protein n=1 Tax=Senegalia massiliensis TaxID=1720316 RepID=A0A845QZD0_9CLOT|nr:hypothetical protein [Senegalia massiliensis]NBI07520.1 hypothetical protein [Senegalia massiliensis]